MAVNEPIINSKEGARGYSGLGDIYAQGLSGYSGYSGYFTKIPYIADATESDILEKFNLLMQYLIEKGWIVYEYQS